MNCPSCETPVDASQRFCPGCGTGLSAQAAVQAPVTDPLLGQVFGGKYRVVRLLGEGGMGAVYEGEQQLGTAKRKVAVKTLHPHLSRDPKIQARFEREVGTIAELEHPNTIQVYDFGSTPDAILYIVMEFLHGKSLADALATGGAMAPERVERILAQACGSLEEAHGRGIVHRDLKPDNVVLVERAGQKDFVKILDFGIAKRAREEDRNEQKLTQQGMVLGTPPYMSPEQFTGAAIDSRSDIYSLGVMVYEMLTGQLPFKANTAWEWATQHMTQPPIPIESLAEGGRVPIAMRNAIARALGKSPNDRFQKAAEFFDAFSGKTSGRAGTEVGPAAVVARQRTELGAPLDVAAAFGAGPPPPSPGIQPRPGLTPAGGNLSFPTPAGIPQAPPREKSSGARGTLLAAAAVIGVASLGAIAFAMHGSSRGASKDVVFDNGVAPAPSTSLSAAPVTGPETTNAESNSPGIPPLAAETTRPHPGPVHPAQVAPEHANPPPAGPTQAGTQPGLGQVQAPGTIRPEPQNFPSLHQPEPGTQALPLPTAQPTTQPVPPVRYDGPDCLKARTLKALGHPKEAQPWALSCLARGGSL